MSEFYSHSPIRKQYIQNVGYSIIFSTHLGFLSQRSQLFDDGSECWLLLLDTSVEFLHHDRDILQCATLHAVKFTLEGRHTLQGILRLTVTRHALLGLQSTLRNITTVIPALYKVITELCGLSRQVVFPDRDSKHDFVKTDEQGKWWHLSAHGKTGSTIPQNKFNNKICNKDL